MNEMNEKKTLNRSAFALASINIKEKDENH